MQGKSPAGVSASAARDSLLQSSVPILEENVSNVKGESRAELTQQKAAIAGLDDALTAAGIDVPTVRFGRWGRSTVTRPQQGEPSAKVAENARIPRLPNASRTDEDGNVLENVRLASGLSEDRSEVESLRLAGHQLEAQTNAQRKEVSAFTLDAMSGAPGQR